MEGQQLRTINFLLRTDHSQSCVDLCISLCSAENIRDYKGRGKGRGPREEGGKGYSLCTRTTHNCPLCQLFSTHPYQKFYKGEREIYEVARSDIFFF